jgi:hypothetical protein
VLDGLDALGDDHGVGPLGLGPDGVDDAGRLGGGAPLEQAHVQLDEVGADEREHGQGGRGGPDVVQGHPQPAWRAWATVASSRAGSPARARSVTSTTTRSRPLPSSMAALRSSGQATPSETGSALTNRVSGGPSPPRMAPVKAAARQAQSSSATRPARQAAPNRAAGVSRDEPIGPLASAS